MSTEQIDSCLLVRLRQLVLPLPPVAALGLQRRLALGQLAVAFL